MLKPEQIRPFLLGAIFTTGVVVVVDYTSGQAGYIKCMADVHQELFSKDKSEAEKVDTEVITVPKESAPEAK